MYKKLPARKKDEVNDRIFYVKNILSDKKVKEDTEEPECRRKGDVIFPA
jgi:hypothetical protein